MPENLPMYQDALTSRMQLQLEGAAAKEDDSLSAILTRLAGSLIELELHYRRLERPSNHPPGWSLGLGGRGRALRGGRATAGAEIIDRHLGITPQALHPHRTLNQGSDRRRNTARKDRPWARESGPLPLPMPG